MTARIAALLIIFVAASPIAFAQSPVAPPAPAGSFAPSITVGKTVWVTNAQGAAVRGKVSAISSTALELTTEVGSRHFASADVSMIQKKDSNKNGFWIGAGVGLIAACLGAASVPEDAQAGYIALGVLTYGGIGAWIDSAIEGRELLYLRPDSGSAPVIKIAPIVGVDGHDGRGSRRVGLGGSISWK